MEWSRVQVPGPPSIIMVPSIAVIMGSSLCNSLRTLDTGCRPSAFSFPGSGIYGLTYPRELKTLIGIADRAGCRTGLHMCGSSLPTLTGVESANDRHARHTDKLKHVQTHATGKATGINRSYALNELSNIQKTCETQTNV